MGHRTPLKTAIRRDNGIVEKRRKMMNVKEMIVYSVTARQGF
jgi:hypothetical protein